MTNCDSNYEYPTKERKSVNDNKSPFSLVYIMGDGRSGSTILSIILSDHIAIESVGELSKWADFHGYPKQGNEKEEDHLFWQSVRNIYFDRYGSPDFSELISIQKEIEDYRNIIKLFFNRLASKTIIRYQAHTWWLLDAIYCATGKKILVDSGKNPGRAYLMLNNDNFNVKVIHLVRDPRGVLWSQIKKKSNKKPKLRSRL